MQATFDVDPSLAGQGEVEASFGRARCKRGLIRQFRNAEGKPFLAYLLPPTGDRGEGAEEEDDEPVDLEWVRDYSFEGGGLREGHSYFLAVGESAAAYNALEGRISLTRGAFMNKGDRPSRITLSRRALDSAEHEEHKRRLEMLELAEKPPLALTDQSARVAAEEGGGAEEEQEEQPLLQDADPAGAEAEAAAGGGEEEDDPFGGADGDDDNVLMDDEDE